MDVMTKILFAIGVTPILMYALMVATIGGSLLRSRRWEVAFQRAAIGELGARGLGNSGWSLDDASVAGALFGPKELPDLADAIDPDQLAALNRLVDRSVTAAELIAVRRLMLVRAVRRQLSIADRVRRLRHLPRVWWMARAVAEAEVAVRGVWWVASRHLGRFRGLFADGITVGGVLGVLIGVLQWLWLSSAGAQVDLISVAGTAGVITLFAAVWWGSVKQVAAVAVAIWGEPRGWSRDVIARLVLSGGIVVSTVVLYATGGIAALTRFSQRVGASVSLPEKASVGVGMVLLIAGIAWIGWRLVQRTRIKQLRLSVRIASAAVAGFLGLVAYAAVQLAIDPDASVAPQVTRAWMLATACVAAAAGLVGAYEWTMRWRRVRQAGVKVPLRWFGWRSGLAILAFNGVTYAVLSLVDAMTFADHMLVVVVAAVLFAMMLAGPALILAWLVAGWLYVRRVDRYYEDLRAGRIEGENDSRGLVHG